MTASITDLTDLLIACGHYAGRDDFSHLFPRFVRKAEDAIFRHLRVGDMEKTVMIKATEELPTNFIEARSLTDGKGVVQAYSIVGRKLELSSKQTTELTLTYYARPISLLDASDGKNWLL